jgi:hypothetical protein
MWCMQLIYLCRWTAAWHGLLSWASCLSRTNDCFHQGRCVKRMTATCPVEISWTREGKLVSIHSFLVKREKPALTLQISEISLYFTTSQKRYCRCSQGCKRDPAKALILLLFLIQIVWVHFKEEMIKWTRSGSFARSLATLVAIGSFYCNKIEFVWKRCNLKHHVRILPLILVSSNKGIIYLLATILPVAV